MPAYTYTDVAHMIDHSLLQPTLTDAEMEQGQLPAVFAILTRSKHGES